jgi:hypothetical protein
MSHFITTPPKFGRVLQVDDVYGNDATGRRGEAPFKTVAGAISSSIAGDTIWVSPGTYNLPAGVTLKDDTALRGMSLQTTTLQMTGVLGNTTLLTMGERCRVEDVNINLTSAGHYNLIGVNFPGTTSVTSKIRPTVVTVDNSSANNTGTSNVYGILCSGSGSLGSGNFSFNSLKGMTVNVKSNGSGSKRGIYVSGPGAITTRDVNIYVSGSSTAPGSFYGAEVVNSSGQLQLRTSTIFGTTADISQTSGSIEIGPGVDLINKTANGKNFTVYIYPTTIFYGAIGALSGVLGGDAYTNPYSFYLSPGSAPVQPFVSAKIPGPGGNTVTVSQYPDPNINYYSAQQKAIAFGLFVTSSISPGGANSTKVILMKNGVDTAITGTLTDGIRSVRNYDSSIDFAQFDLLSIRCEVTGSTNTTHDLFVQVDMF